MEIRRQLDNGALVSNKWLRNKIHSPIQQAFKETLSDPDYHCFSTWFSQRGNNNRKWMKITDDTEPFPGIPPHFWGVMSDGDELPDFTPGRPYQTPFVEGATAFQQT